MSHRAPYLHCLYAEDVRQELSGQYSVIGAFQGGLSVPITPLSLPKITVVASLFLPSGQRTQSVRLELRWNDDVLQPVEPPQEFLEKAQSEAEADAESMGFVIQFAIGISPFEIKAAGKLRAVAFVDGSEVAGNALKITVAGVSKAH